MAASKTAYDFDKWTEEDEEHAIASAVPNVKHIIAERRFVGRFEDGDIVEVPLSISLNDIDALQAEYPTPVDQFRAIIRTLGGEEAEQKFSQHDLVEAVIMSEKFFRVLQRVQAAAFPES